MLRQLKAHKVEALRFNPLMSVPLLSSRRSATIASQYNTLSENMDHNHIEPDSLWKEQLVEKHMWPVLGDLLKDPEFNQGLFDSENDLPFDLNEDQFMLPTSSLPQEPASSSLPLCTSCNCITTEALEQDDGYCQSKDVKELLRSARTCPLCDMIQKQLCRAVKYHVQRGEEIPDAEEAIRLFAGFMAQSDYSLIEPTPVILKYDTTSNKGPNQAKLVAIGTLVVHPKTKQRPSLVLYWGRLQVHGNRQNCQVPLLPRGSPEEVLERLRTWLQLREEEAAQSRSNAAGDKPLPSRLLDLECFRETGVELATTDIKLCETAGQRDQYVALSYCWGGYTAGRTLKANYHDRCQRIELSNLAPLFSQAINVTRGLGVRYLWIDAFCIVQDDAEDWKHEAADMFNIYSNTICRLAVNDCKSPVHNFFPPQDNVASVKVPSLYTGEEMESNDGEEEHGSDFESTEQSTSPISSTSASRDFMDSNASSSMQKLQIQSDPGDTHSQCGSETDSSTPRKTGVSADHQEEAASNTHSLGTAQEDPRAMYLTIPKAYALEVDSGVLNTRAWVLQERLLAPRTIHFTTDHIYCEDQDDLCGEDWVRRYFTWRSCIDKSSVQTPINLFPERGLSYDTSMLDSEKPEERNSTMWIRSMYRSSRSHLVSDPWLRVCEKYSRCNLSVKSDKLAAFAGLVKKWPSSTEGKNSDAPGKRIGEKNLLGLWESNLGDELLWYATWKGKLKYCHGLGLPSWSWIAYDGSIFFTAEGRSIRDQKTASGLLPEFVLMSSKVPDMMTSLPLESVATLTLRTAIREIGPTSQTPTNYRTEGRERKEIAAFSPFNFNPQSTTIPLTIAEYSDCRDIYDELGMGVLIGFASFDVDQRPPGQLFCAHISSVRGDADEPILAYGLVLIKLTDRNVFRRVGICEINYHWISRGDQTTFTLI